MSEERRRGGFVRLRHALDEAEAEYAGGTRPTVGSLMEPLGSHSAPLAAVLVALPFLSPLSMGALTAPGSLAICILALRVMRPSRGTPLPGRLLAAEVPRPVHAAMVAVLGTVHRAVARVSRPRARRLVTGRSGRRICGVGMIAGAILLAVPIPLLPLTNTLPSVGIVLFGLGWVERNGLFTVLGMAALTLATTLFAGLAAAAALVGDESARALLRLLPG